MKENVAIATVEGKAYFLIVNELKEKNVPFISLIPGESVPAEIKLVITTEKEKPLMQNQKILTFNESELDNLGNKVKIILEGKEAYQKIVVGIDPGNATGLAFIADGKVIEEDNCFSKQEVTNNITKTLKTVDFSKTAVSVKVGNGVPVYKELLEALDNALPPQVVLEVVGEAGTNRPLKENKRSRLVRHISSAIRIAGRAGKIVPRRKTIAANNRTK